MNRINGGAVLRADWRLDKRLPASFPSMHWR